MGEGREETFVGEDNVKNNIKIPEDMLIGGQEKELIEKVYPDISNK